MKTVELEELKEKAKALSSDVLDEIVHDLKAGEAASINNQGPDAQIEYIIDTGASDYLKQVIKEEE